MTDKLLQRTAEIVGAYVKNNRIPMSELPNVVADVSTALNRLSNPPEPEVEKPTPAVNPKRSVFPEYIICLDDGLKFKSLKRHIMTSYGLTPDQYREKWGLPSDYPMVAPDYAAQRSELARKIGLGRKAEPVAAPAPVKKTRAKRK